MTLPSNETRIVCTIGPASDPPDVLREMIRTGMDVARLNFSHGAFEDHKRVIGAIRAAAAEEGKRVAILAALPGPKIRIGMLANEPITLKPGSLFNLTAEEIVGDEQRLCQFQQVATSGKAGRHPFLKRWADPT